MEFLDGVEEQTMGKTLRAHWLRWVAAIVGGLLVLKSTVFLISRMLGFTRREVEARGGDVAFVLGLAARRRAH